MQDIKIFISCHKKCFVPNNNLFVPIQVGAKGKEHFEGMLHDDQGENISEKNPRYCELTAQYWAWKNMQADYYGFFHYRRYLSFVEKSSKTDAYHNLYLPYLNDEVLAEYGVDEKTMRSTIENYDVIMPRAVDLRTDVNIVGAKTVYNHYAWSHDHDIEDLDFVIETIKRLYPDFEKSVKLSLYSCKAFFLNMYIMKKEIFHAYCEWMFPILDEFDKHKNYSTSSVYEYRTPGLIAERLIGIFLEYLKAKNKDLKIKECDILFFHNTDKKEIQPAFNHNNVVVSLSADDNYAPLVGVTITSILKNSNPERNYDIIVLSNNISLFNKNLLLGLVKEYKNFSLRIVDIVPYIKGKDLYEKNHINISAYARFALLDLLKECEKAVYIDCDLVLNADIAELYDTDLKDNLIAAVRDVVHIGWSKNKDSNQAKYDKNELGLDNIYDYFNSGVLVLNLTEFRKIHNSTSLIDLAASRKWDWQDQDVLNKVCNGRTIILPQHWNYMAHNAMEVVDMSEYKAPKYIYDDYLKAKNNPKIIHYAGRHIPCYRPFTESYAYFWKYARQCDFYEIILHKLINESVYAGTKNLEYKKPSLKRRIANFFFPKGTKRREWAKRVYFNLFKK